MSESHHTPSPRGLRIAVGYDGSDEARAAMADAAHRAGPLGQLFVVVAFHAPPDRLGEPQSQRMLDEARMAAATLVDELRRGAVPRLRDIRWESEVLAGDPAACILRVAEVRDVDEVALGSRGRGRAAAVLGSVTLDVLHRTNRPVRVMTALAAKRLEAAPPVVA
jgi:nucleotide-binding universal stress UspA family protein